MPRKTLLILIVCSGIHVASACGNEYALKAIDLPVKGGRLDIHRLINNPDDFDLPYWTHREGGNMPSVRYKLADSIATLLRLKTGNGYLTWPEMQTAFQKGIDHRLLSDYAWYELKVGDKANAVKLLEKLYARFPSEYNIVANLGTAYEVTGENEKALGLLRKAVAINPQSHHGSEWIHIRILEQKVTATPDYTQIIGLPAGQNYREWLSGKNYHLAMPADTLMIQIAYQLHERISFVPFPDPIVGQLILDFGDLVAMTYSKEEAAPFYERALLYDPKLFNTIAARRATHTFPLLAGAIVAKRKNGFDWLYIGAAVILVIGAVVYFSRRRKDQPITVSSDKA